MKEEKPIKSLIAQFYEENEQLNKGFSQKKIEQAWKKVMGKVVADRTTEIVLTNKKLLIAKISSAPLRHQLITDKIIILAKLQEYCGKNVLLELMIR